MLPPRPDVTVVGIGASAGGLSALKEFFRNVADDSGLAYVVVVHLSPEHESHLADLLQPHSHMQVLQVRETVALQPNCVYVIPPNANLNAIDTHLRLSALEARRAERAPIDHFFQTLAEAHDGHAIGVVLTGTGSDGTLGIKEIKLRGGLTVAQDPNEAEYDGMPQSAVATGLVDLVLPVSRIPAAVLRISQTEPRLPQPAEGGALEARDRDLLQKVFAQVRARTGRIFSRYKRATLMRRIHRRMQLTQIEEFGHYVDYLRRKQDEVLAFADDLLINVTSFFRDSQVFERLRSQVIPKLFENKGPTDDIRVWCVGCATGEEVYSVAILLLEEAERRELTRPALRLFATDLHQRSLDTAREGFYAGDIAAEVPPELRKRYFDEAVGGYRVKKAVRELVVFAQHNVLGDPPFSRMDLILCRNLLIYLQRDIQGDVLRIFRYALRPGGFLVLGTAEAIDDSDLFSTVDKPNAIHRRGEGHLGDVRLPALPLAHHGDSSGMLQLSEALVRPQGLAELHRSLVVDNSLPSALVGSDGQFVYLSPQAGRYLEHPGGPLTASVGKLVRQELALELVSALQAAGRAGQPMRTRPVPVKFNGDTRLVALHVRPADGPGSPGYSLVIFDEFEAAPAGTRADGEGSADREVAELSLNLAQTRQRLQSIVEEFETAQEEMKAANEELQSTNEELRSTMEELETSKEELQSMNEELQTVNQENRHKVDELSMLSADLQNLLTATDIATLFLDRDLRILRFTPKVEEIFSIRLTDRGRPLSDLTTRLGYTELEGDAEQVLRQLTRKEREVEDDKGRWFLTRILPYRTSDDRIAGVVITFVDVTRTKVAELQLQELARSLEERVADRTGKVKELTTSLVRAEQVERRKLSETMHDELQQVLYAAQMKMQLARNELSAGRAERAEENLAKAGDLLGRSAKLTRQMSVEMNPPILGDPGQRVVLDWLQEQVLELYGLDVHFDAPEEVTLADPDVRLLLFQVYRELLFNAAKHSGADSVDLSLREEGGEVRVVISDAGRGFDLAREDRNQAKQGLRRARERIELLGGRLQIESRPGGGTRITLAVPRDATLAKVRP